MRLSYPVNVNTLLKQSAELSPALRLLLDGARIIMQIHVEVYGEAITQERRESIQEWYDRCYEMLGEDE